MTVLYFLICLAATTVGAISGVGGGVIIKPVLDAVSPLPVAAVTFSSGCTVLAMSVVSLFSSRGGSERVDTRRVTLLAVGAAAGGLLGKQLFELVRALSAAGSAIGIAQNAVLALLTLGVMVYMRNRPRIRTRRVESPAACVLIGLALGALSSFIGIGGGPINLAVLYYFFSMDTKTAALNSLYVILFSQTASFLSTLAQGVPAFRWTELGTMVLGGVLGGIAGRRIAGRLSARGMDTVFSTLLLVITGISLYNIARLAL